MLPDASSSRNLRLPVQTIGFILRLGRQQSAFCDFTTTGQTPGGQEWMKPTATALVGNEETIRAMGNVHAASSLLIKHHISSSRQRQ